MTKSPDRSEALAAAKLVAELENRKRFRALDFYKPYLKQQEFHDLGAEFRERMLSAANQVGKTESGAAETAMHMTGIYPKWWKGRRWDRPTRGWICGRTGLLVRDVQQKKLCGTPGVITERGTGYIPQKCVDWDRVPLAHGYSGLYDTLPVKHVTGGISVGIFKTYEQGREKFQGDSIDWGWADEEMDIDLYIELLTRCNATDGMVFVTYTPRKGSTELTRRFRAESPYRAMVKMSIYDAPHISPQRAAEIVESTPEWERPARIYGDPVAGTGLVFEVAEETIIEEAIARVPAHWAKLWGIDFGGSGGSGDDAHPFGAVLIAWDKDADCIHVIAAVRMRKSEPFQHARAMLPFGKEIPVAWPFDGNKGVPGYGKPMADLYRAEGLKMCPTHAAFSDGSLSTEAGITEMDTRMKTDRFKVAAHLAEWREEFRGYHREEGELVKERDDLMSATRVAVMAKRFAKTAPVGADGNPIGQSGMCSNIDFDVFDIAA